MAQAHRQIGEPAHRRRDDPDRDARGLGLRMQRFAMIVEDGVVKYIAVEAPGKFEVSSAEAILAKL